MVDSIPWMMLHDLLSDMVCLMNLQQYNAISVLERIVSTRYGKPLEITHRSR